MNRSSPLVPKLHIFSGLLSVIVFGMALGELYRYFPWYTRVSWLSPFLVNLSFASLVFFAHIQTLKFQLRPRLKDLLPGGFVLLLVMVAVLGSRTFIPGFEEAGFELTWALVGTIGLVPVAEEILFRVGFSGFFQNYFGTWAGVYLSALLFSLVHSNSTLDGWTYGGVGIVPGAFLLGICCELLYVRYKSLWMVIFLHAMCNATPVLFGSFDLRWVEWLRILYH